MQIENIHRQFVQLGRQKNKIQYQLLHLLPMIYKQEIYKKYCRTIEGYAWRFAQIPRSVVEKTLKLEKHLANKPFLKAAVAEVGIHKVALVANLATPETDTVFADKVRNMSKDAVQELSKELRQKDFGKPLSEQGFNRQFSLDNHYCQTANQNSAQQGLLYTGTNLKCQAKAKTMKIDLDEEMTFLFLKFKQKLEKEIKQSVSNHEVMKNLLAMPFMEKIEEQ